MIESYNQLDEKANIVGLYEVPYQETNKYGIVDMVEQGNKLSINSMVKNLKLKMLLLMQL